MRYVPDKSCRENQNTRFLFTNFFNIYIYIYIYRTNVIQLGSMYISNSNITLDVSDAFCVHPQQHLKTVVTASGV